MLVPFPAPVLTEKTSTVKKSSTIFIESSVRRKFRFEDLTLRMSRNFAFLPDNFPSNAKMNSAIPGGDQSEAKQRYECKMCPYVSDSLSNFNRHKSYHEMGPGRVYKCDQCPYYTSSGRGLAFHITVHSQGSQYLFSM